MFDAYSPSTIGLKPEAVFQHPGPDRATLLAGEPKAAPENAAPDEDITQEVFLRLVVHLKDFRGDSTFRTWLRHLTTNLAIDRRRLARWRKPHVSLGTLDQSRSTLETAEPFRSAAAAEEKRVLGRCLRALPGGMRRVIHLHYWLELTADEIAVTLQIPNGTVKSRLHRGRRLLHDAMQARGL